MNEEHDLFQGDDKENQLLFLLMLAFCANMKDEEGFQGDEPCSPNPTET